MNELINLKGKEMFHKLGFKGFEISYINNNISSVNCYKNSFGIYGKREELTMYKNCIKYSSKNLPVIFLLAIIQLYKELGWLDE